MQAQNDDALQRIQALSEKTGRYRVQAYLFILSALEFTVRSLNRQEQEPPARHVSGQELAVGIKDYALQEFGPTARLVFAHWGLQTTRDFGEIVYDLISIGLLGRNDNDRLEDFDSVFDFDQEMVVHYKYKVERR